MLVLVGKGWTIVRRKLSAQGRIKIAVFFCCYSIMMMVMRYYSTRVMDKGLVIFEYETGPGGEQFCCFVRSSTEFRVSLS